MSSSFHASTVDWLGCWLATGQVRPGESLKVEADLGEQLGVSRTVIREAIKTLAAKGMLEVGPKVGTRVLPVRRWNLFDPQVVGWLSRSGLPENFVDDLLDLRRTIEPMAVRWACERATGEQVDAILLACNALERAVDSGIDYNRADQLFHECILAASHNQFIEQMVPALGALLAVAFEVSAADPDELRRTLPIHRDLAEAIAARDTARGVWACMTLIDNADLAIKRYYPQVMADKKAS
ncbi:MULTISPECIES: FadR/GntR family transcriptional regulator [Pseudomonas]|uniref:Fatty acid metabolism regulator protein n=1 Tax=Pseudomonas fluorescens TaxID=294 RepID=A0A5E6UZ51_PSEFL|nr:MULTISPECIES: FadR/GntR family transcriptional regulator [Pseudomonas]MCP1417674.1 DNA-binding FadR family transcriptional regulator [Pseudomonas laurylsulfativorans]VVN10298.1 Fatty acid metabolism regulator protein [Pseudomonas fluorescens]